MSYFVAPNSATTPLWQSQTDDFVNLTMQQDKPHNSRKKFLQRPDEWDALQSSNNSQYLGYDGEFTTQFLGYDGIPPSFAYRPVSANSADQSGGKQGYSGERRRPARGSGHNTAPVHGYNPAPHRNWWLRYRWHKMPTVRRPAVDYATNHWIPPYEIPLEVYNYPGYEIVEYPVPRVRYYWPIR